MASAKHLLATLVCMCSSCRCELFQRRYELFLMIASSHKMRTNRADVSNSHTGHVEDLLQEGRCRKDSCTNDSCTQCMDAVFHILNSGSPT
jgi:hypothetical protein